MKHFITFNDKMYKARYNLELFITQLSTIVFVTSIYP